MAKRKSRFERLGDHRLKNRARQVRELAVAGDAEAIAEAATIDKAATPAALRENTLRILMCSLNSYEPALAESGCEGMPRREGRAAESYADALDDWVDTHKDRPLDSLEGNLLKCVRTVAHILRSLDDDEAGFRLGVVLGYGLARDELLALREFIDGPALAREREIAKGRSEGGRNAAEAREKNKKREALRKFAARKADKPSLTKKCFARDFAKQWRLKPETVRDWLKAPRGT